MALRIRGSRRFRRKVLAALGQLCPCNEYVIDGDGVVSAIPLNRAAFCECYCSLRVGCNLLAALIADPKTVTIRRGRNRYKLRGRSVGWSPSTRPRVRTAEGKKRTPAEKVLGHELIHAFHHLGGDLDTTSRTDGVLNEEIDTVRGENQLRREQGQPRRTHYGRRPVPDPGRPNLDASDQQDCGCDELSSGEKKAMTKASKATKANKADKANKASKATKAVAAISEASSGAIAGAPPPADERLADRLAAAKEIRATRRPGLLDSRLAKVGDAPHVLLETVSVSEEAYGFVLLARRDRRLTLYTNLRARRDGDAVDAVPRKKSQRFKLRRTPRLDRLLARFDGLSPVPGVGGDPQVFDGTLEILTLAGKGDPLICALYGLDYAPLDSEPEAAADEPDRTRQLAVELVYRIWAEVVD